MGARQQAELNMNKPLISVIVTNYNHEKFLEQALDSLYNQTYRENLEVIFIDDKSTDNSRDVFDEWDKQHPGFVKKVLWQPENKGKWFVLNKAIEAATGTLITLQDADDYSCPQRIERQLAALQAHGSLHNLCMFFHCGSQEDIDSKKDFVVQEPIKIMGHQEVLKNVYMGFKTPGINHYFAGPGLEVHGATCLFYKQLWENGMKFLPGGMGLRCQKAEDSDFNTKMTLLLQKTSFLLEPQYLYRRGTSTNNAWLEDK